MRIFVYVLAKDGGFAPNPFHGWCTLACCKPAIRRRARLNDWVVGVTPAAGGNRLAYAMRVDETLSFEEYWLDRRFKAKQPSWEEGASPVERNGDNCYQPLGKDKFRQLRSWHFDRDNDRENEKLKVRDLGGKQVLASQRFCYYGVNARDFPKHLTFKRPARFNRVISGEPETADLLKYLDSLPNGIHGHPRTWPEDDPTWRAGRNSCG